MTDRQKKKIIADYVECGSYNATAKMNGVTHQTLKRVVNESTEIIKKVQQKKSRTRWICLTIWNPEKNRQKIEIELFKLKSQIKDNQPEEEAEDNFMDALNGTAADVWEDALR